MPFFSFLYKLFVNLSSSYERFQRCLWQMSCVSICLLPCTTRLPERFQKLIVVRGPQLLYRFHTWKVDLSSPRSRTQRLIHLPFFRVQWRFHQLETKSTYILVTNLLLFMTAHQILFLEVFPGVFTDLYNLVVMFPLQLPHFPVARGKNRANVCACVMVKL